MPVQYRKNIPSCQLYHDKSEMFQADMSGVDQVEDRRNMSENKQRLCHQNVAEVQNAHRSKNGGEHLGEKGYIE